MEPVTEELCDFIPFFRMTSGQATSKVKFDRRRAAMDSDDDDLDDL